METVAFLGSLLAVALWVRFKEGRPFSSLGFRGTDPLRRFLIGMAIGAAMITLSVLLLLITGQYQAVDGPAGGASGLAAVPIALFLAVAHWTLQASTEETITRGYQVQVGALQLPGWVAILAPGLIFSLLHMTEKGFSEPVAIVNILLFALFASFITLKQGSLWMACGIHTAWNWFQGNVFGVPVSGLPLYNSSVFSFGPADGTSRFVSGGSFGPEGSLMVTLVWGIAAILAYRYFRSAQVTKSIVQPI
jgi:membrane protease YdiL (CAAX protease family)